MGIYISFSLILMSTIIFPTFASHHPYLQAIHVLDPSIQEFKYHSSWNSDQWIQWVRNRYVQDLEGRRIGMEQESSSKSDGGGTEPPIYGQWVNIVIIASPEEINSAFPESSNRSYPNNPNKSDFLWSDISFTVFVVVRKFNSTENESQSENNTAKTSSYNVFNCSNKKMYINALVLNFSPVVIKHLFPKKVRNPKDTLRIPLVTCSKVGQVRGLLDEIKFQLNG